METFESSFATEIGRVQDVFYGVPSSDQKAFVAKTLGPYSTTEHLRSVKESRSVVLEWHEVLLACIRGVHKLAPTICARHAFITQVAVYDAWAAYKDKDVSAVYSKEKAKATKAPQLDKLELTISFAAFATLSVLFQSARLDEQNEKPQHATKPLKDYLRAKYPNANVAALKVEEISDLDAAIGNTNLGLEEAMLLGLRVARDVLKARMDDGSNQLGGYTDTTNYPRNLFPNVPANDYPYPNKPLKVSHFKPAEGEISDPNFWQPLDVEGNVPPVQTPATPHWGRVHGFAMKPAATDGWTTAETDQILKDGKFPSYEQGNPTSGYKVIVDEVLAYSAALNDKNKVIADYWADYNHSNLPPGHWCALTVRLMYERKYTTDQAVQLLFVLTAALFDASIACWSGKYLFNKPRPITAANVYPDELECVYTFQGTNPIQIAPNKVWRPYQPQDLISPNFPAYPSGHSTFGAAFATVMDKFTGSPKFKALVMVPEKSLPSDASYKSEGASDAPATDMFLYWETFEEASQENGISRLYNGVHYQPDNVYGMEVGRYIGKKVLAKAFSYFETAHNEPSQGTFDEQDGVGNVARKGNLSDNGKQDGKQSRAEQISQTIRGAAQQAFS